MLKLIKRLLHTEEIRFAIVGVANTIIGTSAMLFAYNILGFGYWISSILNYVVGSIFSYFANKYFTFKSEKKSGREVIRFAINIVACYFLAYGVAQPVMTWLLGSIELSVSIFEQLSMILGMCIFIVLNYFGQKYFVFRK